MTSSSYDIIFFFSLPYHFCHFQVNLPKNYAEINSTKPPLDVNSMPKSIEMRPTKLNLHKHYGIQCDDKEWKQDQLRHVDVHLLAIIKYMLSFYVV